MQNADSVQIVNSGNYLADEFTRAHFGQVLPRAYIVHQITTFAQLSHQIIA